MAKGRNEGSQLPQTSIHLEVRLEGEGSSQRPRVI